MPEYYKTQKGYCYKKTQKGGSKRISKENYEKAIIKQKGGTLGVRKAPQSHPCDQHRGEIVIRESGCDMMEDEHMITSGDNFIIPTGHGICNRSSCTDGCEYKNMIRQGKAKIIGSDAISNIEITKLNELDCTGKPPVNINTIIDKQKLEDLEDAYNYLIYQQDIADHIIENYPDRARLNNGNEYESFNLEEFFNIYKDGKDGGDNILIDLVDEKIEQKLNLKYDIKNLFELKNGIEREKKRIRREEMKALGLDPKDRKPKHKKPKTNTNKYKSQKPKKKPKKEPSRIRLDGGPNDPINPKGEKLLKNLLNRNNQSQRPSSLPDFLSKPDFLSNGGKSKVVKKTKRISNKSGEKSKVIKEKQKEKSGGNKLSKSSKNKKVKNNKSGGTTKRKRNNNTNNNNGYNANINNNKPNEIPPSYFDYDKTFFPGDIENVKDTRFALRGVVPSEIGNIIGYKKVKEEKKKRAQNEKKHRNSVRNRRNNLTRRLSRPLTSEEIESNRRRNEIAEERARERFKRGNTTIYFNSPNQNTSATMNNNTKNMNNSNQTKQNSNATVQNSNATMNNSNQTVQNN